MTSAERRSPRALRARRRLHRLAPLLLVGERGSIRRRAMTESRRFIGRPGAAERKLPPGQHLTRDFPVLSAGPTPHVPLEQWEFTIDHGTQVLRRWSWKAFRELPT